MFDEIFDPMPFSFVKLQPQTRTHLGPVKQGVSFSGCWYSMKCRTRHHCKPSDAKHGGGEFQPASNFGLGFRDIAEGQGLPVYPTATAHENPFDSPGACEAMGMEDSGAGSRFSFGHSPLQ